MLPAGAERAQLDCCTLPAGGCAPPSTSRCPEQGRPEAGEALQTAPLVLPLGSPGCWGLRRSGHLLRHCSPLSGLEAQSLGRSSSVSLMSGAGPVKTRCLCLRPPRFNPSVDLPVSAFILSSCLSLVLLLCSFVGVSCCFVVLTCNSGVLEHAPPGVIRVQS